jgi:hypothetical protein
VRRIIALLLTAFLAGCATVGVEQVEKLQPGTKVVPLSLLGNVLAIRHVGTTVFQNKRRDLDVTDWQIDNFGESIAARIIRDGHKFVALEADTKEARNSAGKLVSDFWTSKAGLQGGPDSVIRLAAKAGADYILVLGPSQLGDPFFGTNQAFSGYGVYQRSVFGSKRAINYLTMRVVLLDGKSGTEVARTHGFLSAPRTEASWMDSENLNLSMDNTQETKSGIQTLVQTVLRKAMADLKLIP